jgi:hypothetical protein
VEKLSKITKRLIQEGRCLDTDLNVNAEYTAAVLAVLPQSYIAERFALATASLYIWEIVSVVSMCKGKNCGNIKGFPVHAMKAYRGNRFIPLLILNVRTRCI